VALTGFAATVAALAILLYRMATIDPRHLLVFLVLLAGSFAVEALYRSLTGRRLAEYIDERLRVREENIRRWEEWLPRLAAELRKRLRDAEIYLVGSVARGELRRAHDVDLLVVTRSPPRTREEARRLVEEAKRAAGLTRLHPVDVHFARPEEKERWLRRSGASRRVNHGVEDDERR